MENGHLVLLLCLSAFEETIICIWCCFSCSKSVFANQSGCWATWSC